MEKINTALTSLGIKGNAQRVFIFLAEHDVSPVSAISENLKVPKSSVYDSLNELSAAGLIIEYSENRSKEYGAISEDQLRDLVTNKIQDMKSAEEALLTFMKSSDKPSNSAKPKIKFYMGPEGIRQAFRDTKWTGKYKDTYIMWPTTEMVKTLTPEFCEWHSKERLKHKIMMHVINKHTDRKFFSSKKEEDKKLINSPGWDTYQDTPRYAPANAEWSMSYWIYGDKCLLASGAGEQFAFVVHSKEFADLMKLLWQQMWNVSKE
jgi:sugar-specific transcriptional regulator TrmB